MTRARLRANQIIDADILTESEHDSCVHENLTTSGILNFQDGTVSGTGDIYCNDLYIPAEESISFADTSIVSDGNVIKVYHGEIEVAETYQNGSYYGIKWGNGVYDVTGSGTPESNVSAPVGSTYRRIDGGSGTSFYIKESGTGNTGWVAK